MIVETFIELAGKPCLDPKSLAEQAVKNGLPVDHWHGLPNSFYSALGRNPGYAYLLLDKASLDSLNLKTGLTLKFSWAEEGNAATTVNIYGLRLLRATALYAGGGEADDTTPFLCLFVDARAEQIFSTINDQYNVRCPTHPTTADAYYHDTLNSGSKWTWQTLLNDIWSNLPTSVGTPQLDGAFTWTEQPEAFRFLGMSAWDAYNTVLGSIVHDIWYDPTTSGGEYPIHDMRGEDLAFVNLEANPDDLIHYAMPYNYGLDTFLPEKLEVFFPRVDDEHGSENDAFKEATHNWITEAVYGVEVNTNAQHTLTGTKLAVWNNHPAEYDYSATTPDNAADLADIAADIADSYNSRIQRMSSLYHVRAGLHTDVLPGPRVNAIRWADTGDQYGMTTELFGRQSSLIASVHTAGVTGIALTQLVNDPPRSVQQLFNFNETIFGPDFARKTYPVYPRHLQLVRNVDTNITETNDWMLSGKICRISPEGVYTDGDSCWLRPIDSPSAAFSNDLDDEFYFMGKQVGRATTGSPSSNRPVYVINLRPC